MFKEAMYTGKVIDELFDMVERAEKRTRDSREEASPFDSGCGLEWLQCESAEEQPRLAGVA
jgi:hypothetical protein